MRFLSKAIALHMAKFIMEITMCINETITFSVTSLMADVAKERPTTDHFPGDDLALFSLNFLRRHSATLYHILGTLHNT